jgi:hypothetical protein
MTYEFINNADFMKQLNDLLPDTDFIAVFGTSHTYGACRKDSINQTVIADHDIWINIVGEHLGMPVVNFALEGNVNTVILSQVIDFLKLPKSKLCKRVFLEVRVGERVIRMSSDIAGGPPYNYKDVQTLPKISDLSVSKYIQNKFPTYGRGISRTRSNNHNYIWRLGVPADAETFNKKLKSTLVAPGFWKTDEDIPTLFIKRINEYKDIMTEMYFGHDIQYIDDWSHIQIMITLLKTHGIDCLWFCWDGVSAKSRNKYAALLDTYDQTMDIKKYMVKDMTWGASTAHEDETGDTLHLCDCGHRDENFHQWIAHKIYTQIEGN